MRSLSSLAWRGVALHCMVLALGFISSVGEVPAAFVAWAWISLWGALPGRLLRAVLAVSSPLVY